MDYRELSKELSILIAKLHEDGEIKPKDEQDYYEPLISGQGCYEIACLLGDCKDFWEDVVNISTSRFLDKLDGLHLDSVYHDQLGILLDDCQVLKRIACEHDQVFLERHRNDELIDAQRG